jgi:hypothetical protein
VAKNLKNPHTAESVEANKKAKHAVHRLKGLAGHLKQLCDQGLLSWFVTKGKYVMAAYVPGPAFDPQDNFHIRMDYDEGGWGVHFSFVPEGCEEKVRCWAHKTYRGSGHDGKYGPPVKEYKKDSVVFPCTGGSEVPVPTHLLLVWHRVVDFMNSYP